MIILDYVNISLIYYEKSGGKAPMAMNLRIDNTFVQDKGWDMAFNRYNDFINQHKKMHILFLELGVGYNTPVIIKYPFWQMTAENPNAVYISINYDQPLCPKEINQQTVCIKADISNVMQDLIK